VTIRDATESDAPGIAAVHVRSWQEAYRGHLDQNFLDALDPVARAQRWIRILADSTDPRGRVFVAEEADEILGFAHVAASRDPDADPSRIGELIAIYVDPVQWKKCIGSRLMAAALTSLRESGFEAAMLWVLSGNVSALRFYESTGWAPDGSTKQEALGGRSVSEVRYRRLAV
jgi:GNAT superfamily N-acetyltransferase